MARAWTCLAFCKSNRIDHNTAVDRHPDQLSLHPLDPTRLTANQEYIGRPLFSGIIFDASQLAGTEASGDHVCTYMHMHMHMHHRTWFKERPEQIVYDLVVFRQGGEAFDCRGIVGSSQALSL